MSDIEREAYDAAKKAMDVAGMDFRAPWDCSLDDEERERFEALTAACKAYSAIENATIRSLSESRRRVLVSVEWKGSETGVGFCPSCGCMEEHDVSCELAKAIAE